MSALEPGAVPALLAGGFVFAEGPRWRNEKLWFSDMHGEAVYSTTLAGETKLELAVPGQKPSGIGFLPEGAVLIVSMTERLLLRLEPDGTSSVHARLDHLVADEINDMVVAQDGTAFVGSYPAERGTGALIRVRPDGSAEVAAEGLDFPNGTVLSSGERTLIVAESLGRRFTAFDLDSAKNLNNRRVVATVPGISPDGIALDAEGAIWAGFPIAREFRRVLPGGEVTDIIPTGERMAVACCLGGNDRRTLFLLSANDWSAANLKGTRTSIIETVSVHVPGIGSP